VAALEQRPQFYEGQYLEASDLSESVDYARSQLSRTQLAGHTWGIALGLEIVEDATNGNRPYITPGYAWDGFGRPLVVTSKVAISETLFTQINASYSGQSEVLVDVWLGYSEQGTRFPKPGFQNCNDNANSQSRIIESYQIFLGTKQGPAQRSEVQAGGTSFDASQALHEFDPAASELQDASVPFQELPVGNERFWLVPLGSVRWVPGNPGSFGARNPTQLSDSKNKRRYCGLVGESIEASAGHVRIHDRTKPYSRDSTSELLWVEGDARFDGSVRIYNNNLDFAVKHNDDSPVPFQLFRKDDPVQSTKKIHIGIGDKTDGNNKLAIGPLVSANPPAYRECMVVTDDGKVGIGESKPQNVLHVKGASGIRQNKLFLTGDKSWNSLAFNAYHNDANGAWVFDDPNIPSMTAEIDNIRGNSRFELFSTTKDKPSDWLSRFYVDGDSGNVGIGNAFPSSLLDVAGSIRADGDVIFSSLFALGSPTHLRVLCGRITGQTSNGVGFSVVFPFAGFQTYKINFDQDFADVPSVSVTAIAPGANQTAYVEDVTKASMLIAVKKANGQMNIAADFTFMVMGPR
jgi:hypothetical protein